jgi:tetratricopeptide (TPR) repeat protein
LTPPGSARALDEPPPLLDGPPPEPAPRPTTQLVRATAVEAAVSAPAEEEPPAPTSHRRGALIAGAVSMLVLGAGILWLAARNHEPAADTAATEAAAQRPAPPPAPVVAPLPPAPVAKTPPAKPAVAALDEAEERNADPKLARTRALEAGPLLAGCRTAYQDARMKDAEAACLAARDANPKSAEANGFLAHALLNRGRRREALAAAELAVKLNQKWADPYAVIGTIHQDAGEIADARRAYQRYLELEPHGSYANELRTIVERLGKL